MELKSKKRKGEETDLVLVWKKKNPVWEFTFLAVYKLIKHTIEFKV